MKEAFLTISQSVLCKLWKYMYKLYVFIQVYKKEKWPFIIVFQDITYSYVIQSLYMKMKETKLTRDQEEKHL